MLTQPHVLLLVTLLSSRILLQHLVPFGLVVFVVCCVIVNGLLSWFGVWCARLSASCAASHVEDAAGAGTSTGEGAAIDTIETTTDKRHGHKRKEGMWMRRMIMTQMEVTAPAV